jgi:uncharacterized protein YoxC
MIDPEIRSQLNRIETGVNGNGGKINNLQTQVRDMSNNMKERFDKLSRWLRLPQLLNLLTLITVLHNAAMLSQNLLQTLGDVISTGLAVVGLKDEDDNPIDINSILGKSANDFIVGILGEEVWNNLVTKWKAASRVYQSASNIVWTVRSITDTTREVLEWTAENTGKIGNALKKYRVVGENAYNWMPERVTAQSAARRRLDRMIDGIEALDDAGSSLSSVTSDVLSITEEVNQLREQKTAFDNSVRDAETKLRPDNNPVKNAANAADAASQSPTIDRTDLVQSTP